MKKKLSMVISTLLMIGAIIICVLLFFFPKNTNNNDGIEILNISAQDLSLRKGDVVEHFYSVSGNAEVTAFAQDSSIVKIDGDCLTAIKQGKTSITIQAKTQSQQKKETILVQISADKQVVLSANKNCEIKDGKIVANNENFSVKIAFLDEYGDDLSCDYTCTTTDKDVVFKKILGGINIHAENDFSFEICFDEDTTKTIYVKINFEDK